MQGVCRRQFLTAAAAGVAGCFFSSRVTSAANAATPPPLPKMQFGLVTYLWGQHMDLPTLLAACQQSGLLGVELRTQHAHGVEPALSAQQRKDVLKQFADSGVTLVGYGSNAEFHDPDPAKLKHNIELTKKYIHLMHDCGGSGVKVKPNAMPPGVPQEKTIEQIGRALNELAEYGAGYGQQIRVEVHGKTTSELPVIKAIFDIADHPNVGVCWNSNAEDLHGAGLRSNFELVKDRFGDTVHVRELDDPAYPYAELIKLLVEMDYAGWILLEARTDPEDKVRAMGEQRALFDQLLAAAMEQKTGS